MARNSGSMLSQEDAPALLSRLPQGQLLRHIWVQHYFWEEGQLRLRNKDTLPPAHSRGTLTF
jgi:hypothetical protein